MVDSIVVLLIIVWSMIVIVVQNILVMPKFAYQSILNYIFSVTWVAVIWLLGLYAILVLANIL